MLNMLRGSVRPDGRQPSDARAITLETGFVRTADGSCLIAVGGTRVICTASVEEGVPPFLRGSGKGWVTAEYAMLPASTGRRKSRDGVKKDGRGVEIQRLIGRSLRQAVDLTLLGERTVTLDCDVLEADGGTRTASITGAYVALTLALDKLYREGTLSEWPIVTQIAAISAGLFADTPVVDLCYAEDSRAQADVNVVMNALGGFVEIQGTGEGRAFSRAEMETLLRLSGAGIRRLMAAQRQAIRAAGALFPPKEPLLIATGNAHKLAEFKRIFGDSYEVVGLSRLGVTSDVAETGATFAENARIKAEDACARTGLPAVSDDSGLCVDALGGAPGIYSARYAGGEGEAADGANRALLLERMRGQADRRARFVCAMALAAPDAETIVVEGECAGTITEKERGRSGFGYDPLFLYESGRTFAEMPEEEKNEISHRARAAEKMRAVLAARAEGEA